jgi:hypothetical protein
LQEAYNQEVEKSKEILKNRVKNLKLEKPISDEELGAICIIYNDLELKTSKLDDIIKKLEEELDISYRTDDLSFYDGCIKGRLEIAQELLDYLKGDK